MAIRYLSIQQISEWICTHIYIIWYRVLPQGECQFLFAVRFGCVVVWPIFSTSKMKAFCIDFYQEDITFKNIINLVSFIINLVEYLVINSYSVTVLDNLRKETCDRVKKHLFGEVFNSLTFILGNPPPPSSTILDEGLMKVSLWQFELPLLFYHISTGKRAMQLLHSCMTLSINNINVKFTFSLVFIADAAKPYCWCVMNPYWYTLVWRWLP